MKAMEAFEAAVRGRESFVLLVVGGSLVLVPLTAEGKPDTRRPIGFEGVGSEEKARLLVCDTFVAVTRELVGPGARAEAAAVLRDFRARKGRSV